MLFSEPKIPQSVLSNVQPYRAAVVSVLFSEPKIPQYQRQVTGTRIASVSVLFSEPKIPQYAGND